jgi:acyl-coenzyme A thioesterase PaaI-like protein
MIAPLNPPPAFSRSEVSVTASIMDLMKPDFRPSPDGESHIGFKKRPEFTIPGGMMQGGIVAVMLDMAMAMAGEGKLSTASLQYEILRPVLDDEITVKGKIVRAGRRIVFAEAVMTNAEGVVLAKGTQTAVPLD